MEKVWNIKIKPNTIFVSIASYRDDECNLTIKRLFEKAKYPHNIFVGLCQQNSYNDDEDSLYDIYNNNNIRVIRIPYYEAKGPTYARFLCSSLYNGEEYYFQIDSHTKFIQDWDEICINMIKEIKLKDLSKKPILSHYPKSFEDYDNINNDNKNVPIIVLGRFDENNGIISMEGSESFYVNNFYNRNPYLASGMFFVESYFLNEVPYNARLDYLFVGEEVSHAIRLYTYGWDIYTPNINVIFHDYTRSGKPKIWDNITYSAIEAEKKIKILLKMVNNYDEDDENIKHDLKFYGLGTERTIEEYYDFAGIDIENKKIIKNFGKLIIKEEDNIIIDENILDNKKEVLSKCLIKLLKKIIIKIDGNNKDKSNKKLLKLLK